MKRILVFSPPEDRAHRAAGLAANLAERTGARLLLLRALPEAALPQPRSGTTADLTDLRRLVTEAERGEIQQIADSITRRSIEVDVRVTWGVAWQVILEEVDRFDADLVVKPAYGLTHDGPIFFGSTALHLFRRCSRPIWVVGDDGHLPERIIAAVDPTAPSTRRDRSTEVLALSERVAGWSNGSVHVVSAAYAPGAEVLRGRVTDDEFEALVDDVRSRAEQGLREILDAFGRDWPEERLHLVDGEPVEALPTLAKTQRADLIVLGTRGRAGAVGDLLGETAEMILRAVRCSVLTLPPGDTRRTTSEP